MARSVLDEARNALKQIDAETPSTSGPSTSSSATRQRTAVARRSNAWRQQTTTAQQSGALGLVALAAGGYFIWKWWNNRRTSQHPPGTSQQVGGVMHVRMLHMHGQDVGDRIAWHVTQVNWSITLRDWGYGSMEYTDDTCQSFCSSRPRQQVRAGAPHSHLTRKARSRQQCRR